MVQIFVEICNIYHNQMLIEVALSIINSDKLCHGYDDRFWHHLVFGTQGTLV